MYTVHVLFTLRTNRLVGWYKLINLPENFIYCMALAHPIMTNCLRISSYTGTIDRQDVYNTTERRKQYSVNDNMFGQNNKNFKCFKCRKLYNEHYYYTLQLLLHTTATHYS